MSRSTLLVLVVVSFFNLLPRFAAAQTAERCMREVVIPSSTGRAPLRVRIPCEARPAWEGGRQPATHAAPSMVTPAGQPVRPPRTIGTPSAPIRPVATATTSTVAATPAIVRPAPLPSPAPRVAIPVPTPMYFAPRVVPGQPASGPWVTETQRWSPQPGVTPPTFAVLRAEPPPVEEPAPSPPAIMALPDTSVRHVPVWFPGFAGFDQAVQAIVCVGRNAREARVETMTPEQRIQLCREWSQGLPNGRAADIVLPRTAEWENTVVSLYARHSDEAEWHYENQQMLEQYPNGVPLYASDLNAREQTRHLLYAPLPLPATRVVAAPRHGRHRAHNHHGRRRARR